MKELKYNFKCLLERKELYFAIIGILLINLIHVILVIHFHYNSNLFYENGYKAEYLSILYNINVNLNSIIIIILPILSATVFSDMSFIENKSKIDNMLYFRLSRKKLIITRIITILFVVFIINFIAFFMNYISLALIYGSGNALTYIQNPAFYMVSNESLFLDSLRIYNVNIFIIVINLHVSLLISLLSVFAYSISFFVKQKIIIYILPLLTIIITELLFPFFNLYSYSIVGQLQPMSQFNMLNALTVYLTIVIISVIFASIHCSKKDYI